MNFWFIIYIGANIGIAILNGWNAYNNHVQAKRNLTTAESLANAAGRLKVYVDDLESGMFACARCGEEPEDE